MDFRAKAHGQKHSLGEIIDKVLYPHLSQGCFIDNVSECSLPP